MGVMLCKDASFKVVNHCIMYYIANLSYSQVRYDSRSKGAHFARGHILLGVFAYINFKLLYKGEKRAVHLSIPKLITKSVQVKLIALIKLFINSVQSRWRQFIEYVQKMRPPLIVTINQVVQIDTDVNNPS